MQCKECHNKPATRKGKCHTCYQRAWARANYSTDKSKARRARWHAANHPRMMWLSAKHRAKHLNLPFTISINDIVIPKVCPVLGIELCWNRGRERTPSIDRRDNALGYTKENVLVISMRANRIKNDATATELRAILHYAEGA